MVMLTGPWITSSRREPHATSGRVRQKMSLSNTAQPLRVLSNGSEGSEDATWLSRIVRDLREIRKRCLTRDVPHGGNGKAGGRRDHDDVRYDDKPQVKVIVLVISFRRWMVIQR